MKIIDIMLPGKAGENNSFDAVLAGDRDLLRLDLQQIRDFPSAIGVVGKDNAIVGSVKRDTLIFCHEYCNSWFLGQVVDRFHEGVVAVDHTGHIFYVNDAYSEILGVAKHNVLGRKMQEIEPGATILEVLATGEPILGKSVQIKSVNHHVVVNIYPIKQAGRLAAVVSIFRDVTETKQLSRALGRVQGLAEYFRQQLVEQDELDKNQIVGRHPVFLKALSQAITVAKTNAPVLLGGENGAGKEVLAKLIHQKSGRSKKPLITVNCAAIPENLLESELFGYAEGSFTGAKRGGKPGKFELADGGTVFLDEIGDMSMGMQSKVLRVLQEKEIEKIGRSQNLPVDVRVIAATNRSLEDMVAQGKFRRDLYYRLNVVAIRAPALRERGEDIGLLAYHFLTRFNAEYEKELICSPEVLQFFSQYEWPGNVRELQNCIEYAVIMCPGQEIYLEHLPAHMHEPAQKITLIKPLPRPAEVVSLRQGLQSLEKEMIENALSVCGNNKTKAMKLLDVSRRAFYQKLKQYNLS